MNRVKGHVLPRPGGVAGHQYYLLGWISGILVTVAILTAAHYFHLANSLMEQHAASTPADLTAGESSNRTTAPLSTVDIETSHQTDPKITEAPPPTVQLQAAATHVPITFPAAVIHTDYGDIVLQLFPEDAPVTVNNFATMSNVGVFNHSCFYRYEKGFVLQGGLHCTQRPPNAKKAKNVVLEYKRPNIKYSVALARAGGDLNSGGSEFFINLRDNTKSLGTAKKGGYAVFAQVVDGFDTIANLKALPTKTEGLTRFVAPQPVIEFVEILNYDAVKDKAEKKSLHSK